MNYRVQRLVQLIFQKDSIEDCTLQELQSLARQYPYFGAMQLMLAEKMSLQHPSVYQKQLQKASLYFHDPLWFDYLLNEEDYDQQEIIVSASKTRFDELTQALNETEDPEEPLYEPPVAAGLPQQHQEQDAGAEPTVEKNIELQTDVPQIEALTDSNGVDRKERLVDERTDAHLKDISTGNSQNEEPLFEAQQHQANTQENAINGAESEHEPEQHSRVEEDAGVLEDEQRNGETSGKYEPGETSRVDLHHEPSSTDDENIEQLHETEASGTFRIPMFRQEPLPANTNVLSFEPYHTVDYFASQGIRLNLEDKPTDRFGKQLRSFTDWLKAMKRLPEAEILKNSDAGAEKKVVTLAEHSLKSREVVTEAMAEVWEQQGNKEKAIEIYNKLSLLDPSKSAYFAAKIEHLK